jgi:hypothetical protein
MKVSKRQLRRIIKEERARVLSEQPVEPTSEEEKAVIKAEAGRIGGDAFNTIMDHAQAMLDQSVGLGYIDIPHPAVFKVLIEEIRDVATALESEMKDMHPPEFITLWEPGYGPGSA